MGQLQDELSQGEQKRRAQRVDCSDGLCAFFVCSRFFFLCGLPLRCYGVPGFSPGIKATFQGVDVLIAASAKFLRQTGAGSFIGSSAVGDHCPALGDL